MAIWQFDLYVIKSEVGFSTQGKEGPELPLLPLALVHNFQEELAHYMGPPWLMLDDWIVFGPENGNRIDVVFESEFHASISVRCDIREEAPQFLVLISDLTRFQECQFFDPQTRYIIEPDLELVLAAIRRSQVNLPTHPPR